MVSHVGGGETTHPLVGRQVMQQETEGPVPPEAEAEAWVDLWFTENDGKM